MPYSALLLNGLTGEVNNQGIASLNIPAEVGTLAEALTLTPGNLDLSISLPVVGRSISQLENGSFQVVLKLEGQATENSESAESYELDLATSAEPIQTHPDFDSKIKGPYKAQFQKNDDGTENPDGQFTGFAKMLGAGTPNPFYGQESYLVAGCVWRRTFAAVAFPSSILRALGKIDTPAGGKAQPPHTSGKRNWLKTSVRASWKGNIWQITEEWTLSDDNGWNPVTYRAA